MKDPFPFQAEPHVQSAGSEVDPALALPDSYVTPEPDVFPPSLTPDDVAVEPDAPLPDPAPDPAASPDAETAPAEELPAADEAEPAPDPKEPDAPLDAA